MAASRHDMRDVELVEEDGAPGADPPGAGVRRTRAGAVPPLHPHPLHAHPPRRGRTAGAVVVLMLGLLAGDLTADARARAGRAALVRVPGVVAPLDRPPTELWRSDPTLRPELVEAGGHLVGVMTTPRAADVVALDPATGAVVWRSTARETGLRDGRAGVRCVSPAPTTGADGTTVPTVVCLVDRATRRTSGGPRTAVPEDRLLTMDARTGDVLADRVVERSTVVAALDGDVVTGHVDARGFVHVRRTDPSGRRERWSFVSPHPLPRPHLAWSTRVDVHGGVVVVDEGAGWVLSADGEVLHSWAGHPGRRLEGAALVVGGGRYLVRPRLEDGTWPTRRSEVTDLRSGRSSVVAGRPLPAWPDDGSVGTVLLRTGEAGHLVAHDPSGAATWHTDRSSQGRALVLDGHLVGVGPSELSAIDGRTGDVVWSTPRSVTPRTSLATDGRLVLMTERDPDRGVVLRAYGLDDGRVRWAADLPDDVVTLTTVGSRLFGWTGRQLVALGVPAG